MPEEGVPLVQARPGVNARCAAFTGHHPCYGALMHRLKHFLLVSAIGLPLALPLAACASDGSPYPSLARRAAERIANTSPPVPQASATPLPPDPAMLTRIEAFAAQARTAHAKFVDYRPHAEALVGQAGDATVASESWSVATVALAELESARSEAMVALAELDALHVANRLEGTAGTSAAIDAARDAVMVLVGEEDRTLAALRGRLAS